MPCYDGRDSFHSSKADIDYAVSSAKAKWNHNSVLAELMCKTCKVITADGYDLKTIDTRLAQWWKDHQARDAKIKAERDKKRQQKILKAQQVIKEEKAQLAKLLKKYGETK